MSKDPIIKLFEENPDTLELLGRVWELLYIESSTPDIGKRRENFLKLLLRYEFGFIVEDAPDTERFWDFRIKINQDWYHYNMKTAEKAGTIKVAWDGFPSVERAESFSFKYPILYIVGNRSVKRIEVYVFSTELIYEVKNSMEQAKLPFWWIPKNTTNPRGFGLSSEAVSKLIERSKKERNYVEKTYHFKNSLKKISEEYWRDWYYLLKKLAGF